MKNNSTVTIITVITYYLLVVLPHKKIGYWITKTLDEPYGRDTYNLIVLILGLICFAGYLWPVWKNLQRIKEGKKIVGIAFVSTFLLIIIAFNILLVVNVEIIHFLQYAILAFFLYPLLNNYRDTLFFSLLLAILDEGYQYLILAPLQIDYFDFNDLIIDFIGGTLGLLLIWLSGVKNAVTNIPWYQTSTFIGTLILALLVIVAYSNNILAIYPTNSDIQAPILLIRRVQENFWFTIDPANKFHIVKPLEGVLILVGLFYFYSRQIFGRSVKIIPI